jgi:hypothetical protein
MNSASARSQIHLQMGQEIIYVLMALGLIAALVLIWVMVSAHDLSGPAPDTPAASLALPEKPPILNLTERGGFHFESGSIELSTDFRTKLRQEEIPEIVRLSSLYRATVIEVIGYTDGVPVKSARSSMDQRLIGFLNGARDGAAPMAIDNVGLGMGRAAAVIRALREDPQLSSMTMLPLSAGQTTGPHDEEIGEEKSPAPADEQRRRIEIRLRRRWSLN